jgi:hypothetical protein
MSVMSLVIGSRSDWALVFWAWLGPGRDWMKGLEVADPRFAPPHLPRFLVPQGAPVELLPMTIAFTTRY